MPDTDTSKLRDMTEEQICHWIAGFNDARGGGFRLLGEHELQRRLRRPDAIRSWIALSIATLALIVSIASKLCQ